MNKKIPRLPLEGSIDLTYRCNNRCRHCWLWLNKDSSEIKRELNFEKWKKIFDEARQMGSREWVISGGEPMLHPDFTEIFDYLTAKSVTFTLNTNGTMITPEIAKLMKRKGSKMIALYGADSQIHDMITRLPGSFELAMEGFSLLKEYGAGFTVQVVPMKDNYHQLDKMINLAKTLSPSYRIGTSWLFYSAYRSGAMNAQIEKQRLDPKEVVKLDPPLPGYEAKYSLIQRESICSLNGDAADDRLFHKCITTRNSFHIDPYGKMTFCSFVKDPMMKYDLMSGSFEEAWEEFIPALADKVHGGEEYLNNCGSCEKRSSCSWCAVYSWLEHGRYSAPVKYLCDITDEKIIYKKKWKENHNRYYKIGGITIQISSDIPLKKDSFLPKVEKFRVKDPGKDIILLRYHFAIPDVNEDDLGEEVYRKPPWAVFKKRGSWIYREILTDQEEIIRRIVVFNGDHSIGEIYLKNAELFTDSPNHALSLFPSDQLLLSRILADRKAITLHSSGMIINGAGLIFTGRSGAGKSTIATLLKNEGELLCDEFIIIRKAGNVFRIYGTWSHGDIPDVSNSEAPMKALIFLEKSNENRLVKLSGTKDIISRLLPRLMQPLVTTDWWEKTLATIDELIREVPVYVLKFDRSGKVRKVIRDFTKNINKEKK